MSRFLKATTVLLLLAWPAVSPAVLTIEITEGGTSGIPIAIVPFGWAGTEKLPQDIANIIHADLARSGKFAPIDKRNFLSRPQTMSDVVFKDWRLLRAEALVIGQVSKVAGGRYQVEFRLYDVFKQTQLTGFRYTVTADLLRLTAHQISDLIYEKLIGEPGAFTTRIAYVTKHHVRTRGRNSQIFRLQVADADGYGPQTVVESNEPLMSPSWSPDGTSLAYVSFEQRRSVIYTQNVATGKRRKLADFKGINGAPAWSPDGTKMALTLSRDGNAEIYVMRLADGQLTRLTRNRAIDTEPVWSPDGRKIVFTSDRSRRPQLYIMEADGSYQERLTFEGDYNARASFSPDNKRIALVTKQSHAYHIGVLNLSDRSLHELTDTHLDESPSFAPNGAIIIYATEVRGRGVLASVSADGRTRQLYRFESGDVREPAWSPYNRQLRYKE